MSTIDTGVDITCPSGISGPAIIKGMAADSSCIVDFAHNPLFPANSYCPMMTVKTGFPEGRTAKVGFLVKKNYYILNYHFLTFS